MLQLVQRDALSKRAGDDSSDGRLPPLPPPPHRCTFPPLSIITIIIWHNDCQTLQLATMHMHCAHTSPNFYSRNPQPPPQSGGTCEHSNCVYSKNLTESLYHPERYKTKICTNFQRGRCS